MCIKRRVVVGLRSWAAALKEGCVDYGTLANGVLTSRRVALAVRDASTCCTPHVSLRFTSSSGYTPLPLSGTFPKWLRLRNNPPPRVYWLLATLQLPRRNSLLDTLEIPAALNYHGSNIFPRHINYFKGTGIRLNDFYLFKYQIKN